MHAPPRPPLCPLRSRVRARRAVEKEPEGADLPNDFDSDLVPGFTDSLGSPYLVNGNEDDLKDIARSLFPDLQDDGAHRPPPKGSRQGAAQIRAPTPDLQFRWPQPQGATAPTAAVQQSSSSRSSAATAVPLGASSGSHPGLLETAGNKRSRAEAFDESAAEPPIDLSHNTLAHLFFGNDAAEFQFALQICARIGISEQDARAFVALVLRTSKQLATAYRKFQKEITSQEADFSGALQETQDVLSSAIDIAKHQGRGHFAHLVPRLKELRQKTHPRRAKRRRVRLRNRLEKECARIRRRSGKCRGLLLRSVAAAPRVVVAVPAAC